MMKIKFLGSRLPKVVSLPLPFISKCEKTGEVVCNPVGEFTQADGEFLVGLKGMFVEFVEGNGAPPPDLPTVTPLTDEEEKALKYVADCDIEIPIIKNTGNLDNQGNEMPLCKCTCGTQLTWKKHYRAKGIPKYILGHYKQGRPRNESLNRHSNEQVNSRHSGKAGS